MQSFRSIEFIAVLPNSALNRTGRHTASFLLASARPAGQLDRLGVIIVLEPPHLLRCWPGLPLISPIGR